MRVPAYAWHNPIERPCVIHTQNFFGVLHFFMFISTFFVVASSVRFLVFVSITYPISSDKASEIWCGINCEIYLCSISLAFSQIHIFYLKEFFGPLICVVHTWASALGSVLGKLN